jgi:pimeloyl-ACP methyl ester carboxylesterase
MLLILQGGAGNADGSEALADELSRDFTVVTYDRRGLSRSTPVRAERYACSVGKTNHYDLWQAPQVRKVAL